MRSRRWRCSSSRSSWREESLRNTRARVEIGTTPPIDIVEAEAEVATREEAVILARGADREAEDTLRALVFDPSMPDFWTHPHRATELPPFSRRRSTSTRPCATRWTAHATSSSREETDRGQPTSTPLLPQPDAARHHARSFDYGLRARRHAVPAAAGLPRAPIIGQTTAASARCSATCSPTLSQRGRPR